MVIVEFIEDAQYIKTIFSENQLRTETFVGDDDHTILDQFKVQNEIQCLIICIRCLEGFDEPRVSVAVILRNIQHTSAVLFTQFVGRAVRKTYADDPVVCTIISAPKHSQRSNYEAFINPKIAETHPCPFVS
jgi:superfamily II DNA or RNA helicase